MKMTDSSPLVVSSPAQHLQSEYKPENKVSEMNAVPLSNYLPLLDERIKVQGFHEVLKEQHKKSGLTIRAAAKMVGVHEVTYRNYLAGVSRPDFKTLKKMGAVYGADFLQVAFDKNYQFVIKKKVVKLPRELTPDLAYYIGYLQGDGYLSITGKYFGFCDEYEEQMKKINDLTVTLFGINGLIWKQLTYISTKPCFQCTINSTAVNSFLNAVFEINKGTKKDLRIPKVLLANKHLMASYVSGLYDADGTLPKNPMKAKCLFLDITMKDKEFIEEIKGVLDQFGISSLKLYERKTNSFIGDPNSPSWEIQIRKRGEILKFLQIIGFKHPDKARRAKEVIAMLT